MIAVLLGLSLTVLPDVVERYRRLADTSPTLGRIYLAGVLTVSGLAVAGGLYLAYRLTVNSLNQRAKKRRDRKSIEEMSTNEKQAFIESQVNDIQVWAEKERAGGTQASDLEEKGKVIGELLKSGELRLAAFGTISSGKSALLNTLAGEDVFTSDVLGGTTVRCASVPLPSEEKVLLVDTPGLGEDRGIDHERIAREQAMDADLIMFVLDSDMRSFEDAVLRVLVEAKKPLIICINKCDWYEPEKMTVLRDKIVERVARYGISRENVVAIRTKAASRTRIRVLEDGSEDEETVLLGADVDPLLDRLRVALKDRKGLHLNNLVERVRRLSSEMRERARAKYDASAWEIVNRTTWQAATAAALSPLPILDLVVGMGFIVKMVKELAAVYQTPIDLDVARQLLAELGANSVSIVGANFATPTAGALAASWAKSVPGIGTLVGGTLQGFMQALMVRWIGSTFIEYFRKELKSDTELADLARRKWLEATQPSALIELSELFRSRTQTSQPTREVS
jgi:predicted GTPase